MKQCKYSSKCDCYSSKSPTCSDESSAGYCGRYKHLLEIDRLEEGKSLASKIFNVEMN